MLNIIQLLALHSKLASILLYPFVLAPSFLLNNFPILCTVQCCGCDSLVAFEMMMMMHWNIDIASLELPTGTIYGLEKPGMILVNYPSLTQHVAFDIS